MDESETRKLDAIVGAAIKALAESGAADELVGSFAASHRAKVAKILGRDERADHDQAPDLLNMVTQALEVAMSNLGLTGARAGSKAPRAKRVYVHVGGKKTSLTISEASMQRLTQDSGGRRKAMSIIQGLADSAPPDVVNRSKWVEERMLGLIDATDEQGSALH